MTLQEELARDIYAKAVTGATGWLDVTEKERLSSATEAAELSLFLAEIFMTQMCQRREAEIVSNSDIVHRGRV